MSRVANMSMKLCLGLLGRSVRIRRHVPPTENVRRLWKCTGRIE